jgi:hypothetical protein
LFARPDNPYQRDWVLPYTLQVPGHRAMVALFALALPLLAARGAALAAVPVLALAATYPLYHVFNKYAVPATPFLILGAALALDRIAAQRRRGLAAALAVAGLAALVSPGELALGGVPPPAAQVLPTAVWALALGAAFVLAGRAWARGRLGIAAPLAAEWRDPTARAFSVALDREVRHEVEVGAEGLRALAGAREAWLFLDLHAADGDVSALRLRFDGGFALDGRALEPAMPTFGLATVRGGRDARGLRQWWRTPWRPEMAAGSRIGLTIDGDPDVRLHGDLGAPLRPASYEALSLGEWPHLSVYRLMHEGEYRLPAGRALEGERRAGARGGRSLPGVLSVRAVVSDDDVGGARWQTAPAPAARIVTAMWARVARQERALVEVAGRVHAIDFARAAVGDPVRFVPTGEGEGWLVLKADAERGRPLTIAFTPVLGTSVVPRVFAPELRAGLPPLPLDWSGLPYVPAARILESRTSPPWRPARVF